MASEATAPYPEFGPIKPGHIGLLLLLTLVWSSAFMAIKIGIETVPPLTLTTGRIALGALVLGAIALATGGRWPVGGKALGYCFLVALFGFSLPFFLISWGETGIDSGLAAVLMSVMPLFTLLLSHFFTKGDRTTPTKVAGICLGFSGIIVLVGPAALSGLGGDLPHQLATAGGAVSYAVNIVIMRKMPASPILPRSAMILMISTLQLVPFALFVDRPWMLTAEVDGLVAVAYLGIFPTAVATLIFLKLSSVREPTFIAYLNYMIPLFGLGWGALFLGEVVTPQALIALALILAGMFVANFRWGTGRG